MKKRPFWKRPPLWTPHLGYHTLWMCTYWYLDEKLSKLCSWGSWWWRELTLTKEQREMQVRAGIRKSTAIRRKS